MGLLTLRRERIEARFAGRLDDVLRRLPVHLPWTALLGVGEDGVPLLVDLKSTPPVLVLAGNLPAAQAVLDSARHSLVQYGMPHEVEITWVTERGYPGRGRMVNIVPPYDRRLEETLLHLADVAESRGHGRLMGPMQVLLLDDLAQVLRTDREALWALEYLLRSGGKVGVWVMACLEERRSPSARRFVRRFGRVLREDGGAFAGERGERFYPLES